MKKNMLMALVAVFAMAGVVDVAAIGCGCSIPKPVSKCCSKPKPACPKKCPRVSKCLSCEERRAQADREAMEAGMNDDLAILDRAVGTADAAVSGAVNTTRDVTGSALGSSETRENLREERQARREDRRLDRQARRDARRSSY